MPARIVRAAIVACSAGAAWLVGCDSSPAPSLEADQPAEAGTANRTDGGRQVDDASTADGCVSGDAGIDAGPCAFPRAPVNFALASANGSCASGISCPNGKCCSTAGSCVPDGAEYLCVPSGHTQCPGNPYSACRSGDACTAEGCCPSGTSCRDCRPKTLGTWKEVSTPPGFSLSESYAAPDHAVLAIGGQFYVVGDIGDASGEGFRSVGVAHYMDASDTWEVATYASLESGERTWWAGATATDIVLASLGTTSPVIRAFRYRLVTKVIEEIPLANGPSAFPSRGQPRVAAALGARIVIGSTEWKAFDTTTSTWSDFPKAPEADSGLVGNPVIRPFVVSTGSELFSPSHRSNGSTWTPLGDEPVTNFAVAWTGSRLVRAGFGASAKDKTVPFRVFDPATGIWSDAELTGQPAGIPMLYAANGYVVALGTGTHGLLDPLSRTWLGTLPVTSAGLDGRAPAASDGTRVLVFGRNPSGVAKAAIYEPPPALEVCQ